LLDPAIFYYNEPAGVQRYEQAITP